MRGRLAVSALVALLALSTTTVASAAGAVARVGHFDGTVVSIDRSARTVAVRDDESGTKRVKVTRSTRFERIAGFGGLRRGMDVEVTARRAGGAWVATEIERRRADNDRGGRDDSGSGRDS